MEAIESEAIVITVTPYTTDSPRLWVPGNYAAASGYGADWTPDDPETPYLEAVEFGSTEFEGFVFMNVASPEFKFTREQNFDNAYGDAGGGAISLSAGNNLTAPGPGYYYISVNTDPDGDGDDSDATYEISQRVWGIIGAATEPGNPPGWNDELDMTYDQNTKKWSVELMMRAEDFKFRAQEWNRTQDLGASDTEGVLEFQGGNLTQDTAGRYRAELDLSVPRNYTYTLTSI